MKILIIGGTGTIGSKIVAHFSNSHDIITAGRNSGDEQVDISESNSIRKLFEKIGKVDAIISVAGEAKWDWLHNLEEEDYYVGIRSKLMGQVNVARIGVNYLHKNGSITLSTGILADDPVVQTASAAMVNGGLHSFVKAGALEMNNGIRLNAVSLGVVEDAYEKYKTYFPGHNPVSTQKMINAYVRSVEGRGNGEIIKIYE